MIGSCHQADYLSTEYMSGYLSPQLSIFADEPIAAVLAPRIRVRICVVSQTPSELVDITCNHTKVRVQTNQLIVEVYEFLAFKISNGTAEKFAMEFESFTGKLKDN